nr:MAG: hypothetical protein DIU68_09020 [Chloroflexota bacterium]
MNRNLWTLAAVMLIASAFANVKADIAGQILPTDTPAAVDLSGVLPAVQQAGPTETPTRTPTPPGPVQIEALQTANVRANPHPEAELLGQIRPGEYYNAIRRYYRWIEFQYDAAPNRRGWIYDELVRFAGDESAIPSVESLDQQPEGAPDVDATSTALAITATPGGLLTATAQARLQTEEVTPQAGQVAGALGFQTPSNDPNAMTDEAPGGAPLPTFTYPPGILPLAPTPQPVDEAPTAAPLPRATTTNTTIPPIVPIAVLGGLGLLGLIASLFRR